MLISVTFTDMGASRPVVSSFSAQVETGHPPDIRSVSVEVLEIDLHILRGQNGAVTWPKSLPKIDGVMVCYDALNASSTNELKEVLGQYYPTPIVQRLGMCFL
jgi:hypothetical protein